MLLLRQRGYEVVGADIVPSPTTDILLDIRDLAAVVTATRQLDAVIHTAALHGKHTGLRVPRLEFVRANIEGTLHLLKACVAHGIHKFLYTSPTGASLGAAVARAWL